MMNLRTLLLGVGALSLALVLGHAPSVQAATLTNGSLVKASGPAVYYFSENATRYAFPDLSTYNSWYPDFSAVQTITDSELAQIPFGGLVTIRPGSRMVKIQTDPRVYAVARGGVLRWVQTEELARALYGDAWNRNVSDVPDAFFTNYRIQNEIVQSTDFSASSEQSAAATIDADVRARTTVTTPTAPVATSTPVTPVTTSTPTTPATPTSTPTSTVAFDGRVDILSSGPYSPGAIVTVLGSVTRGYVDHISLSYGTSTALARCTTSPCRADLTVPNVRTTSTIPLRAVFSTGEGETLVSTTATKDLIILPNRISSEIRILRQSQVLYGASRVIRVELDSSLEARQIHLYMDEVLIKECTGTQSCESYENETSPGGTTHTLYAVVTDRDYRFVYSELSTFQVVQ
jgi:hypothetical protein